MEVLGFYDEPYQVRVSRPTTPPKAIAAARTRHGAVSVPHHTARISTLWDSTEIDDSQLNGWKPTVLARRRLGGRRVRLSAVFGWLLATAALVIAGLVLAQRPRQAALESAAVLQGDVALLEAQFPVLYEVASSLGAPDPPELVAVTDRLLTSEAAARRVFDDASAVADDTPFRQSAVAGAGIVLEAVSTFNRLLAFRLTAEEILVPPLLPSLPADVGQSTEAVVAWRSDVESELSALVGEVLPEVREELHGWVDSLEAWQRSYLDAVREGDSGAAQEARSALETDIRRLRTLLLERLAANGSELGERLREAERLLTEVSP